MSPFARPLRPWFLLLLGAALLGGCVGKPRQGLPLGQDSFSRYRAESREWLGVQRQDALQDSDALELNLPSEWRPAMPGRRGILLIHGLGDSPYSFSDIGPALAARGYLVRTVLLPGHGSKPADLMTVEVEDWQQVVAEQTELLKREVDTIYLGGFSTGANLALVRASEDPDVAGLLLFSPAFKSDSGYDWLAPYAAWFKPWLREPEAERRQQTRVRYLNVPTNGFGQFYRSSALARQVLERRPWSKPALLVVAQHDSVLDVAYLRDSFPRFFTHPASRLIWYGDAPAEARQLARSDRLPAQRISQFSHMAVLFSPANPLYGPDGSEKLCENGPVAEDLQRCLAGEPVWYSDWGYREPGKVHARLTFNPYFDWQMKVAGEVLEAAALQSASAEGAQQDEWPN